MGLVEADVIRKESYQSTVTETTLRITFDIKKMSPPFKVCVFYGTHTDLTMVTLILSSKTCMVGG